MGNGILEICTVFTKIKIVAVDEIRIHLGGSQMCIHLAVTMNYNNVSLMTRRVSHGTARFTSR